MTKKCKEGYIVVKANIERDIGKVLQKLEDQNSWLINIDKKLTYTNGKIANTINELSIVKEKQDSCPARMSQGTPIQRKNYIIALGMLVIAALNVYLIIRG